MRPATRLSTGCSHGERFRFDQYQFLTHLRLHARLEGGKSSIRQGQQPHFHFLHQAGFGRDAGLIAGIAVELHRQIMGNGRQRQGGACGATELAVDEYLCLRRLHRHLHVAHLSGQVDGQIPLLTGAQIDGPLG